MAAGTALLMVVTAAGWGQVAAQTGDPEGLPDDATEIPEDDAEDTPEDTPEDAPEDTPEDTPEDAPEDAPEDTAGEIPEDAEEQAPEEVPPPAPAGSFEGCVTAQRLEDGRLEVAVQPSSPGAACGERLLPRRRFLPAAAEAGRWLVTAPLRIDDVVLRVAARHLAGGAVEVAIQLRSPGDGTWGPRLLPRRRFVPAALEADRWLSSSPVNALVPTYNSVLERAQLVTLYGYPNTPPMGILGRGSPEQVADQAAEFAAAYDRLNGDREVIPAFHLITGVAQAHPTPDGTWISRMPPELISEYVELARERGMHVFLDEQIGWSDPLTEVKKLEPFLREPFVHVAIDPEFATKRAGSRPGLAIGGVTGAEINEVQRYLASIVATEGIPPKILMVHQFTPWMVTDRADIVDLFEVDLSIDMDGFGGIGIKLQHYDLFAVPEPSERPAIKVFLRYDTPVLTPEQIQALDPRPDIIVYQ